jgi:hypothetical protein
MVAQKNVGGTDAPYDPMDPNPDTTWCNSVGVAHAVDLSSTGFGSCVGLVLYDPVNHQGAVAHFPGSLGNQQQHATAHGDVALILADVCPAPVAANWKVWIFGGESLLPSGISAAIPQTRRLIGLVRADVRAHLGGNLVPESALEPETQAFSFVGHCGVTLTLANGKITWQEPRGVTRTRQRTGSGSRVF